MHSSRCLIRAARVFVVLAVLSSGVAEACSRVLWTGGKAVVVGRNMDWLEDTRTNLWVLPRGIERNGGVGKHSARWTSRYGSVVAPVYDAGTTDGLNEKGLTVNMLWLSESEYGQRDASVPGIAVSLWAQYFLDNFATVAEAVAALEKQPIQPVTIPVPGTTNPVTVHLSLADASGDSAVLEYVGGKPAIHHDRSYTVMTNSPPFQEQVRNLARYKAFGGTLDLPGSEQAADRFVRAARYVKALPTPGNYRENIAYILSVLRNVSSPFGVRDPQRPNVSATRWRTVADLTNRIYFFESTTSPNVVWVRLDTLRLEPGAPVQKLDLVNEADGIGDVSGRFREARPFVFLAPEAKAP
jgi:choloylglycine hydrolase